MDQLQIPASGDYASTAVLFSDNGNGPPVDLTGYTISVVDVTGLLVGAIGVTVPDPVVGEVRLAIAWQGAWPLAGSLGTFRLSITSGSTETVSAPVTVGVQSPTLRLVVDRGADMAYSFIWPDDREGASLTGETLEVVNISDTLEPILGVEVVDAATRACRVLVEGDLSVPAGSAGTFQLRRRVAGADPRTLPPVEVAFR